MVDTIKYYSNLLINNLKELSFLLKTGEDRTKLIDKIETSINMIINNYIGNINLIIIKNILEEQKRMAYVLPTIDKWYIIQPLPNNIKLTQLVEMLKCNNDINLLIGLIKNYNMLRLSFLYLSKIGGNDYKLVLIKLQILYSLYQYTR